MTCRLTLSQSYSMEIVMQAENGMFKRVTYSTFSVGDESSGFVLQKGGFDNTGNAEVEDQLRDNLKFIWPGDGTANKHSTVNSLFGW